MEKKRDRKCRYCDYPLIEGVPVADMQGNEAIVCENCGNVNLVNTPNAGKVCPRCGEPMLNYKNGDKVFWCKPCALFTHENDIFYSSQKRELPIKN